MAEVTQARAPLVSLPSLPAAPAPPPPPSIPLSTLPPIAAPPFSSLPLPRGAAAAGSRPLPRDLEGAVATEAEVPPLEASVAASCRASWRRADARRGWRRAAGPRPHARGVRRPLGAGAGAAAAARAAAARVPPAQAAARRERVRGVGGR
jgi:hypothetical protein